MNEIEEGLLPKRTHHAGGGKQPLVVRHSGDDFQLEVLERLARVEAFSQSSRNDSRVSDEHAQVTKFDLKVLTALGAIVLSVAGYVIQDARNSSRLDAEIEATKVRVANLEKIATANTEARIRSEVQLGELREGQAEIKRMLEQHEDESRAIHQGRR